MLVNKRSIVLSNGVKLSMVNTDKFKTVDVKVFYEDSLNAKNITCDNLLINILSAKCKKYPTRKLFKNYLQNLYDMKIKNSVASYGETFSFAIGVNALNKKFSLNNENLLDKQFEVLREVLYCPLANEEVFDEDYFNEMKNDYKENLIDSDNYKEVKKKVNEILKDVENLFEITEGYLEELNKLSNKDVFDKFKQMKNMCKEIVVVGQIDFDEVIDYVNKYLEFGENRGENNYFCHNEMKKYGDYSFDSKFSQSSIGVMFDLNVYFNDKLYYPTVVFVEMLNYYLFKIVREEHNFCYSIYATYMGSRGICYLQSNIEARNYEKTLDLINDIISDLQSNIDDKVLNICKDKVINGLRREEDSSLKIITREYFKELYNLKDNCEVIEILKNVGPEDVKEAARKIEKKLSVIVKEGN